MLRLTRKTLLAIEAVLDVAYNARPNPVQSKDITKRQGIPQRYLEQVMQQLVREGILKGVRGPKGGYRLARERRRISVGEIVRVVDELERQEELEIAVQSDLATFVVEPLWNEIQGQLLEQFDAISIEELYQKALATNVATGEKMHTDFAI
ncbi:MAG: Rrf2 family transcriptional regulator [Rhizobiales bacterium]|nr:Rrf2 family transcriptional regulator [Hyphomicrobiales bacterium]NRB15319.1 Rrf2 family transcriptional regulator [Hyphomicrobiales bacterium]